MQVEIKLDAGCEEPKVMIITNRMTEEISALVKLISDGQPAVIAGYKDDVVEILDPAKIFRIFAENGRVMAETDCGKYVLRQRLYEIEQRLGIHSLVRISNSEIINLKKVKAFDLSFVGTICVTLVNGTTSFVSRRYVSKVKQILGM